MKSLLDQWGFTLSSACSVTLACRLCLLLGAAFAFVACDAGVQSYRPNADDSPSIPAFQRSIAEGNAQAFVDDLNKVKRDPDQQLLAFLSATWQQSLLETPPALLTEPVVLVELAATLAQASRNGALRIDETDLHEMIRSGVASEDPDVRQRALFGLSIFDDSADVLILEQAVGNADDLIFRTAVVSLAGMCVPEADEALQRVEPLLSGERRAFFDETLARYREDPGHDRLCTSRRSINPRVA